MLRILIILLLCSSGIQAGEAVIKGIAESYAGKKITVYQLLDYISYREAKKAETIIKLNGEFELRFNIDSTSSVAIRSGERMSNLYVQPGHTYLIRIFQVDSNDRSIPGKKPLPYNFTNLPNNDLNTIIDSLNNRIDKFLIRNYSLFIGVQSKKLVDKFSDTLYKQFGSFSDPYFRVYLKYSIASIEESSYRRRDEMVMKYFKSPPVYYHNDAYMSFFNQFYKNQILVMAYKKHGLALNNALKEKLSYKAILKAYEADTLMKDPVIRELAIIKGLAELYYNREYKRANILALLDSAHHYSDVPEHREIISNLKFELKYLAEGSMIPALPSESKDRISFSDDSKEYTYLSFFEPTCIPCLEQFRLMVKQQEKYFGYIKFISVSSATEDELNGIRSRYKFKWDFISDPDQKLFEIFRITRVPSYFLLSPDGQLISSPAGTPEEIEKVFYELSGGEEKDKKLQKD